MNDLISGFGTKIKYKIGYFGEIREIGLRGNFLDFN
jgi:hypothetical protein